MAQYKDILLSDQEDLQNDGFGDFKVGDASNQLMYYIIKSAQGNWKEFPLVGVGADQYLNSTIDPYVLAQLVKSQLMADVFSQVTVDASDFPITLVVNKTVYSFTA